MVSPALVSLAGWAAIVVEDAEHLAVVTVNVWLTPEGVVKAQANGIGLFRADDDELEAAIRGAAHGFVLRAKSPMN